MSSSFRGDKFEEDSQVEHQQHIVVFGVVLYAEESFGGVVGLDVVHAVGGYELLVVLPVGFEADAAVEEYFEVGPHFAQILCAALL